jgi:N-methylhydantoinase A
VTDANLLLGLLADGARLGGEVVLRADPAERALAALGARLGLSPVETALGVVRVANAGMARALRVISVERGRDPREFALVAFGGAGGLHACALAEELGMRTVLIPRASGVLSALGLAISDVRRDYARTLLCPLAELDRGAAEAAFAELEAAAGGDLDAPALRRRADLRYRRQAFELTVEADDLDALATRFHAAHEQRYGYRMDDEPVELVSLRLVATVAVERPELHEDEPAGEPGRRSRSARFDGDPEEVPVLARDELGRGSRVRGPAIVEFAEATCAVRPGWAGAIDAAGTLVLERE